MTHSPESQVVARQLDYFKNKNILIAGELEDNFPASLADIAKSVTIFTTNLGYANQMKSFDNVKVHFGASFEKESDIDLLLLYWPKAKAEASFLLAMLMDRLGQGCEVAIVGENRSGVKSAEKLFEPYGKLIKFDSARRCSFYFGECKHLPASFYIQDWYKSYPLKAGDTELIIRALPGVFSQNELDKGSELLLESLDSLQGEVLDFGCGAGVLGAVIKKRFPACNLTMVDISALAIESTKETLRFNKLNANVYASDVYSDINNEFDNIISNPPFHAGLKTHYESTEFMLEKAPNYLIKKGSLTLVANNFLKYVPIIEKAFGQCSTINKNNKFSIYQAKKH